MSILEPSLVAAVYGELYASATTQMAMIDDAIKAQEGKGFGSEEECSKWAHDHLLDLMVVGRAQHQFFNLSHRGEMFTLAAWKRYYCENILFWRMPSTKKEGEDVIIPWVPSGFGYHHKAYILGEKSDGLREPINHRNYFVPTGFYDDVSKTFNTAKPFPAFAKQTDRDTSHIRTYIRNVACECEQHLLAWLRYKCINPTLKTEIVPVIVSRVQGNGKTTFAEVICKGLFGGDNVLVTDQYDASSRFNADYADALIVCAEEKEEDDKRNPVAALKSRSTATTIRKENKGVDPIYQANFTEFIVTTNKDVPVKFEGTEDQRRFMVMGSNANFTRKTSELADEVFTKLYGYDANGNKIGVPFTEDKQLIEQFKYELVEDKDLAALDIKGFPHTAEYERCRSLPRTSENTEIDSILRTLAPFIKASLVEKKLMAQVPMPGNEEQVLSLSSFVTTVAAIQYMPPYRDINPAFVALCRPLIFYDQQTTKPFNHATVERALLDCTPWLLAEYGLRLLPSQLPLPGGFINVLSRYRQAPAARFALVEDITKPVTLPPVEHKSIVVSEENRVGERLRVNSRWQPDPAGEFETLNEMKPGTNSLLDKTKNVAYMDTFLFEADDTTRQMYQLELTRLKGTTAKQAASVFMERLRLQKAEADRLLDSGTAFRVVYSGSKSYHILVRIKDTPTTIDEYRWLHAHLCDGVLSTKVDFDTSCNDPARLTRAPIDFDRTSEYQGATLVGKQCLYRERVGQVFDYNWRPVYEQWKNRPLEAYELNGRRLRPAKQEYKDAMWALLNGTFWTDRTWNGRRQQCFFPAYRLCRLVGYSHDQLWTEEGILDGLRKYYRKSEVDYWRTRESSPIIKEIDKEVTEQLEEEEGLE
jgi:hypothetical protein